MFQCSKKVISFFTVCTFIIDDVRVLMKNQCSRAQKEVYELPLKRSLLYMLGLQAYFSTVKLSSTRLLLHYGYGYFLLRNSFAIKRAIRRYFVILTLFSKLWHYVIFERTESEPWSHCIKNMWKYRHCLQACKICRNV